MTSFSCRVFAPCKPCGAGVCFGVIITGTGRKRLHTLKAIIHPGDKGSAVFHDHALRGG